MNDGERINRGWIEAPWDSLTQSQKSGKAGGRTRRGLDVGCRSRQWIGDADCRQCAPGGVAQPQNDEHFSKLVSASGSQPTALAFAATKSGSFRWPIRARQMVQRYAPSVSMLYSHQTRCWPFIASSMSSGFCMLRHSWTRVSLSVPCDSYSRLLWFSAETDTFLKIP